MRNADARSPNPSRRLRSTWLRSVLCYEPLRPPLDLPGSLPTEPLRCFSARWSVLWNIRAGSQLCDSTTGQISPGRLDADCARSQVEELWNPFVLDIVATLRGSRHSKVSSPVLTWSEQLEYGCRYVVKSLFCVRSGPVPPRSTRRLFPSKRSLFARIFLDCDHNLSLCHRLFAPCRIYADKRIHPAHMSWPLRHRYSSCSTSQSPVTYDLLSRRCY